MPGTDWNARVGRQGYEAIYRDALEKNRREKQSWAYVHHITSKTGLLDEVVRGCRIVGRSSLGDRLRAIRPGYDRA